MTNHTDLVCAAAEEIVRRINDGLAVSVPNEIKTDIDGREGPSSTEYKKWLATRPDLQARLTTEFSKGDGYEIWRNAWLTIRAPAFRAGVAACVRDVRGLQRKLDKEYNQLYATYPEAEETYDAQLRAATAQDIGNHLALKKLDLDFLTDSAPPPVPEEQEVNSKCVHCDPSFVPSGADSWCECKCHNSANAEDLRRELAFYFGAYHGTSDHERDAAHCEEDGCVRVRKILNARARISGVAEVEVKENDGN